MKIANYEYGIRHKKSGEMHADGLFMLEAIRFMDPSKWDGADPHKIFEIVRRPIGFWKKVKEDL